MPFHKNATPRAYTKADIEKLNPNQMGVYGIYRQGRWVYVGSGDIRARLLAHAGGDNPRITRENPTSWVATVTSDYISLEKQLIVEYQPVANQKVG